MRFSARSFSLPSSCTRMTASCEAFAPRGRVPLIGFDSMTPAASVVKVGQVWADNDSRGFSRHIKVVAIQDGKALVQSLGTNWMTRIRLDRFKPTSTGYRLVEDV